MPPKPKAAAKSVKAATKKPAAKAPPTPKKTVAKPKVAVKPTAKKTSVKPKTTKKKPAGVIQTVKQGVQTGIGAVGDLVKKVTPDVLLPKSAKSKRK